MAAEQINKPSIVKVWAKNFRSVESTDLDLDFLTVLVGPNASGKSNLLDVLGFLGDVVRQGLQTALTKRGGIDSVGRRSATGRVTGPEVGLRYESSGVTIDYGFSLTRKGAGEYRIRKEFARIESAESHIGSYEVELSNGRLTKPNLNRLMRQWKTEGRHEGFIHEFRPSIVAWLRERSDDQEIQLLSSETPGVIAFLDILVPPAPSQDGIPGLHLRPVLQNMKMALSTAHLYHIFPNSLREPQKMADSHPLLESGGNLASTLRDMLQNENRFLSDLKSALTWAVPDISDIRVRSAGSFYVVELKHTMDTRTKKGSWFDLSYESDGTIRLLAMLTALFQEPALSLIGLEEPELAIHPGAMAVLADTMIEAASRGQVLVATHSPDLIDCMPIESIRAVSAEGGSTTAGPVAHHQLESVRAGLFLPGELHSMEGLQPVGDRE